MNNLSKVLGLLMLLVIASCSTTKKAARQKKIIDTVAVTKLPDTTKQDTVANVPPTPNAVDSVALRTAAIMDYKPVWSQYRDYTTFQGKAQMSYEADGDSKDFTTHFRLEKDKAIWVSVTALGGIVNVARALITPDSIKAIIYLEKEYINMPLSEAEKILPAKIDFAMLQNLIVANPLLPVSIPFDYSDFGGAVSFLFAEADKVQSLAYNKADNTLRSIQLKAKEKDQQMMIQMGNYANTADRFPQARTLHILNEGKQAMLTIDFKEFSFNEQVELPFSIPKSYKKKILQQ